MSQFLAQRSGRGAIGDSVDYSRDALGDDFQLLRDRAAFSIFASARARMRILEKRILKRYGYPPDLADEAVQTVLAQAELLLREL